MRHPDIKGNTWPYSILMWFDPPDFPSEGENDIPLTIEDGVAFWRPPATLYSIIYERFDTWYAVYKAFRAISEQMKRLCEKKPDVACLVELSRTEGRGAVKGRLQTGKQGAAEISIKGQEVAPHIHLVIMASNMATICKAIISKYNKKRGFTAAKSRKMDCLTHVPYIYNQSQYVTTHGCFVFSPYCIPYDEDVFPKHHEYLKWLDEKEEDGAYTRYNVYMEKWRKKNRRTKNDAVHNQNGPRLENMDLNIGKHESQRGNTPAKKPQKVGYWGLNVCTRSKKAV